MVQPTCDKYSESDPGSVLVLYVEKFLFDLLNNEAKIYTTMI